MASLHHLLRLPSSIHPSPPTTFGKPYFSDSSPSTVHLRPAAPTSFIRSSTTLRAPRCYPLTCLTQSQSQNQGLPHHLSSGTLKNPSFPPSSPAVRFSKPFRSPTKGARPPSKNICTSSSSSSYQNYQTAVPVTERLMSAVAYCLPFLNGLNYGIFLFSKFPILELAFDPIVPLLSFYRSIPGASLVAFFTLYLGVVRDRKFSRYVRFNSLQAMMLDVLLVLPSLTHIILDAQDGLKFQLLEMSYSGTFVVIVACFLYALGLTVLGRTPYFPFVTDAVDWQIFAVDRQL
ncbi:hypothetical protein BVC80_1837g88 [Macleaya cordata]|uniref:Protein TIC 20 n=1 Tax=Macleaya cordata TaxID=56857 RepID=A0A200R3M5_MACCD|nr:hypothetical protein BVC80_1837g88 [Macleaya cordata]